MGRPLRDDANLRMVVYGIIQNRPPATYRTTTERVTDVLDAVDRHLASRTAPTVKESLEVAAPHGLSDDALKARKPSPPGAFISDVEDTVQVEPGRLLASKPISITVRNDQAGTWGAPPADPTGAEPGTGKPGGREPKP